MNPNTKTIKTRYRKPNNTEVALKFVEESLQNQPRLEAVQTLKLIRKKQKSTENKQNPRKYKKQTK